MSYACILRYSSCKVRRIVFSKTSVGDDAAPLVSQIFCYFFLWPETSSCNQIKTMEKKSVTQKGNLCTTHNSWCH